MRRLDKSQLAEKFAAAMRAEGIDVDPTDINANGKIQRIHVKGDARGARNGWYVLHMDDQPAGMFGCNKRYGNDKKFTWKSTQQRAEPLTAAERRELRERMLQREHEREEADAARHGAASKLANRIWDSAADIEADAHPYLSRKGIKSHGLRVGAWEKIDPDTGALTLIAKDALLVPIRDRQNRIHSLQAILPDANNVLGRDKDYLKNGDKRGRFYSIGKPQKHDGKIVILICEGYATGATLHESTDHAVVVAFDAPNLLPVAQSMREEFPAATIVMCADHDQWTTSPINNPGLTRAREAASAIGARVGFPPFNDTDGRDEGGKRKGPTDFNDLRKLRGINAVREAIELAIAAAVPTIEAPRIELAPTFNLAELAAIRPELKGPERNWLASMKRVEEPMTAAAWAWSIIGRTFRYAPVRFGIDGLIRNITGNSPPCGFPAGFLDAAKTRLKSGLERRKREALAAVKISPSARKRHHYTPCKALPVLAPEQFSAGGVFLIRAPKGTGKTKSIITPFAMWAGKRGGFVAIVHRISLVKALAKQLKCDLYTDITADIARSKAVPAFATCLPSIVKHAHQGIIAQCQYLAIDEIAQTLASIESDETCRAEGYTNADVYRTLRDTIRQAQCIVCADAGLNDQVIRFLEECRPGERFHIYDMEDSDQGLRAEVVWGDAGKTAALGMMENCLKAGKNIMVACDTKKDTKVLAKRLASSTDRPILCITADRTAERERFMADPQGVSREYAAIVHSPAISSGISIEHEHFSHGFLFYGGQSITPAEASQMMRRVRPLKDWTVVLDVNRASATPSAEAMILGMEQTAELAGTRQRATSFDEFIAETRADQEKARNDGAAGLYWQLKAECYDVTNANAVLDELARQEIKQIRTALKDEERTAILAAPDLTDDKADELRRQTVRTEAEDAAIQRHTIARALGVRTVDDAILDVWTKIGPLTLDRYANAMLDYNGPATLDADTEHLSKRSMHADRRALYERIFDGIDIRRPGLELTNELNELMMSRIEANRHAAAWLEIVPAKYAAATFKRPAHAQKEINELFRRIGMTPVCHASNGKRTYRLPLDFELIGTWAKRRINR